ncbi:hypothetical protein ABZ829_22415 [Streptomyces xanthochromogenes]|uniref:hypothetical protein n=1 Tax=Streptomyces TaxID=1883 RepID=UPI00136BF47C|nr:hypothetical protein [Streptomyces sp. SID1034]MYV91030.1 hypothetical protein [Streptomyces sp. SID1034]
MEHVIDLDQAAAVISERTAGWLAAGLTVGQVTWLDATSPWPRQFETDRALVRDPVSIGVLIDGPGDAGLSVVLFRGGWADVDYFDGIDDGGPIPAFDITSAAAFGTQLDQWVPRAFGNLGTSQS